MHPAAIRRQAQKARASRERVDDIRRRILFGLLGAAACLAMALPAELGFRLGDIPARLDAAGAPCMLFLPATVSTPNAGGTEMERRLARMGAHTGDVQVSLSWNTPNDLDLWCATPSGQHIYFGRRMSTSGGRLDVDMNAGPPFSTASVENIYWPYGQAPRGTYRILVQHYDPHGGPNRVPFQVTVRNHGDVRTFSGTSGYHGRMGDEEGLLRSAVPVDTFTLPTGPVETNSVLTTAWARGLPRAFLAAVILVALWGAALSTLLALALKWGICRHLRRPCSRAEYRHAGIAGAVGGLVAGAAGQTLFGLTAMLDDGTGFAGRALGFALLGGLMGSRLRCPLAPHLPPRLAWIVPAIGGVVADMLFLWLASHNAQVAGRLCAALTLGFAVGVLITFLKAATGILDGHLRAVKYAQVPSSAAPRSRGMASLRLRRTLSARK